MCSDDCPGPSMVVHKHTVNDGIHGHGILTPEYEADTRDLLFHILPVSARGDGSFFDIYTSSPEIFNNSNNKNYPFEDIEIPTLVISAQDDPLALHENAYPG